MVMFMATVPLFSGLSSKLIIAFYYLLLYFAFLFSLIFRVAFVRVAVNNRECGK